MFTCWPSALKIRFLIFFIPGILVSFVISGKDSVKSEKHKLYSAAHVFFQYVGRIDFSNPSLPRFYSPGVYIKARFMGNSCEIELNDEVLYGKNHNYISVSIDNRAPIRFKLSGKKNVIKIADSLDKRVHSLIICKDTETGIGYLEFVGIRCKKLVPPAKQKKRKIEFFGNSITCGTGSDLTIPCNSTNDWYDQHNAYLSYGPLTARLLNADWVLTSVSGIGLIHSCCDMTITMPEVFDKLNLRENKTDWDFSKYQPDVLTVCLGQNDGLQDLGKFVLAYVEFLKKLRGKYPQASIVLLSSPMADAELLTFMKKSLNTIVTETRKSGDNNIYSYIFSKRYNHGCGDHPNLEDHGEIADELSFFIKGLKKW